MEQKPTGIPFLSETKQDFHFMEKFQFHLGYNKLVTVEPSGTSGGLALFYNDIANVTVLFSNNRIIDIETVIQGKKVFLTFVYGDPVPKNREMVWERLTRFGTTRIGPWFMVGDFNELTGNHEKQGGKKRHASTFLQFNTMLRNCGMLEFPCVGNTMSWRGRRGNGVVRCKLDRAIANENWHEIFSHSFVRYMLMVGSDHRPIIANIDDKKPKNNRQFRFDKRWIEREGLSEVISSEWGLQKRGTAPSVVEKIQNCRSAISIWRKKQYPWWEKKIEELKEILAKIQNDDNRSQEELQEATQNLRAAYKDEELFWKQKSRNMWLKEGDNNTKFFHAQTKQRRARNRIIGLHNSEGKWVETDKEILKTTVSYFMEIFSSATPTYLDEVVGRVPRTVTEDMNKNLLAEATENEVRTALFLMHPEKAPGPDGMTALFFQRYWQVMKKDITEMVNNFLVTGRFDNRINMTNICLIPKAERPTRMTEFRPISLCNVSYKIISKVLCQRLKRLLPQLISESQSAFVGDVLFQTIY